MKILLVEGHEEVAEYLHRRLERRGFDVVVATDGRAAVDKSRTEVPDIVVLEVDLPIIDGWTVARMIRDDPATAAMPIIALGGAAGGDREKRLAARCNDYHPKPFELSFLVRQIERLGPKS